MKCNNAYLTSFCSLWTMRSLQVWIFLLVSFLLIFFLRKNRIDKDIEHNDKEDNDEKNKEEDSSGIPLNPGYLATTTWSFWMKWNVWKISCFHLLLCKHHFFLRISIRCQHFNLVICILTNTFSHFFRSFLLDDKRSLHFCYHGCYQF